MELGEPFGIRRKGDVLEVGFPAARVRVEVTVREVFGVPEIVGLCVRPKWDPRSLIGSGAYNSWSRAERGEFRRLAAERATADPPAIVTTDLLRSLPLRVLRTEFLGREPDGVEDFDAVELQGRSVGRQRKGPDHFAEVTTVYREALAAGQPPRVAVQQHFGVERATASNYIARCRRDGLLGELPRPGVAGEVDPPQRKAGK